jgi:hypothetical protein
MVNMVLSNLGTRLDNVEAKALKNASAQNEIGGPGRTRTSNQTVMSGRL